MFNCGNFDCGTLFTMLCQLFGGGFKSFFAKGTTWNKIKFIKKF